MSKLNINKNSGFVITGFLQMDNKVIRDIISETNMQCAMMYLLIMSHRNTDTGKCFPSISTLARESHQSERTVNRQITELHDKGYILINSGKQGIANDYYFPDESFFKSNMNSDLATRRKNVLSEKIDKKLKKKDKKNNDKRESESEQDYDEFEESMFISYDMDYDDEIEKYNQWMDNEYNSYFGNNVDIDKLFS